MKKLRKSVLILSAVMIFNSINFVYAAETRKGIVAFPGAEGGGMYTLGARAADNIEIYHVTNLNDSGEGSFREALSAGNRIIVFEVAGTIMLESDLKTTYTDNITILGQTAPGEGICVGGCSVRFENCNNIIIRYMRFRSGDVGGTQEDGLGIRMSKDIIVDHCSVTWSVDETFSAYANRNFTAQYNIISESLNNSIHLKGGHGYGGIWGGENATFHHNLISTHKSRMPRIGTSETVKSYLNHPDTDSLTDIRNNIFYNWARECGYGGENGARVLLINNYYKKGPAYYGQNAGMFYLGDFLHSTVYAEGNIMEGDEKLTNDNYEGITGSDKMETIYDGVTVDGILKPMDEFIYDYPVETEAAEDVYNTVLANVGASFVRDTIDTKIVNDVINRTSTNGSNGSEFLIDSQEDVGGWIYLFGEKAQDSDMDGIPDEWEEKNGLDKNDGSDSVKISASGYTNIEVYANDLVSGGRTDMDTNSAVIRQAIFHAEHFDRSIYYHDLMDELDASVENAKAILAAGDTERYSEAAENINGIMASMIKRYKVILRNFVDSVSLSDEGAYIPEQWEVFKTAYEKALADLLPEDEDNETLKQDYEELVAAYNGLEITLLPELRELIEIGKKRIDEVYTYTEEARERLADRIEATETRLEKGGLTRNIISNLYSELAGTVSFLDKVDYDMIDEYTDFIENGLFRTDLLSAEEIETLNGLRDEYLELKSLLLKNNNGIYEMRDKVLNALYGLDYESHKSYIYKQDFEGELPETEKGEYEAGSEEENTYIIPQNRMTLLTPAEVYNDKNIYYSVNVSGDTDEIQHSKGLESDAVVLSLVFEDEERAEVLVNEYGVHLCFGTGGNGKRAEEFMSELPYYPDKWNNIMLNYDPDTRELKAWCGYKYIGTLPVPEKAGVPVSFGIVDLPYDNSGYANGLKIDDISVFTFDSLPKDSFIYGDADADVTLTAADSAAILQKVLNGAYKMPIEEKTSDWLEFTDVDKSGSLTAADSAAVLQKVLNNAYKMPVEENMKR